MPHHWCSAQWRRSPQSPLGWAEPMQLGWARLGSDEPVLALPWEQPVIRICDGEGRGGGMS